VIYSERRGEYLRKAEEAKAQMAKSSDPVAKQAWERIATSYRDLANLAPGKESKWHA